MVEEYDWSAQSEILEYVQGFVTSPHLSWRRTGTGLVRHDKPAELVYIARRIEEAFKTRCEDWWVMKQEPGSPGTMMHIHNNWDTYIYYPFASDSHIYGPEFDIMPMPGLLVYLPQGTEHAVEDSYVEEGGPDRYSCVFLAWAKESGSDDSATQGQEA